MSNIVNIYTHTLNGQPAYFDCGGIYYLNTRYGRFRGVTSCNTLEELRSQQDIARKNRIRMFGDTSFPYKLGYTRFRVDLEQIT